MLALKNNNNFYSSAKIKILLFNLFFFFKKKKELRYFYILFSNCIFNEVSKMLESFDIQPPDGSINIIPDLILAFFVIINYIYEYYFQY